MGAAACKTVEAKVDDWRSSLNSDKIKQEWTSLYKRTEETKAEGPFVVVSDMHLGNGVPKEDVFLPCKEGWKAAMSQYHKEKFTLVELGDIEDLWVYSFESIARAHADIFSLRQSFYNDGRLIKIVGNHDDQWYRTDQVKKYLDPWFKGISVQESVRLSSFFLLHGHQGSYEPFSISSDVSACCLSAIWPSCLSCSPSPSLPAATALPATPAVNLQMYYSLDEIVDSWIEENKVNTVIGHTHHPVVHSELLVEQVGQVSVKSNKHYFNTGSCINPDGSFTALEIYEKEAAFVLWLDGKRTVLEKSAL